MRITSVLVAFAALLTPFAAAKLHHSAVCVTYAGISQVYAADATKKSCEAYSFRSSGPNQWDRCPDCAMAKRGKLDVCHSEEWHIGGDEMHAYCKKFGSHGSLAN